MVTRMANDYPFIYLKKGKFVVLGVLNCMENMAFKKSIQLTTHRENMMGSSLARFFDCNLCFNDDVEQRAFFDYTLYDIKKGWLKTIEQTDDYFTESLEGRLCLELYTLDKTNKRLGKLHYSRADKFLFVLNKAKQIIILDRIILKNFIARLADTGDLLTTTPDDHQAWKAKHDTLPTTCALLPIDECLHQDPKSRVINFTELQLLNYDQLRKQNDN